MLMVIAQNKQLDEEKTIERVVLTTRTENKYSKENGTTCNHAGHAVTIHNLGSNNP